MEMLNKLLFGGYSAILVDTTTQNENQLSAKKAIEALTILSDMGVVLKNPDLIHQMTNSGVDEMVSTLKTVTKNSKKDGTLFRTNFLDSKEIPDYTEEDYLAIYAQYSLTYGWSGVFEEFTNENPENVLESYFDGKLDERIDITKNKKPKEVTLFTRLELLDLITNILESKRSLNKHELLLVQSSPIEVFKIAAEEAVVTFNENKNLIVSRLIAEDEVTDLFRYLRTPTDVVRLVLSDFAKPAITGKFTVSELKNVKLHIPTSVRKTLVRVLNSKTNIENTVEDMFKYKQFWKRLDKHLRWGKMEVRKRNFPNYTKMIDLLYNNDTSWTFNSRFEVAKSKGDFDTAVKVASERSGFLMRNILEFVRMTKGVNFPEKQGTSSKVLAKIMNDPSVRKVQTDATEYFKSEEFDDVLNKTNVKLLWELIVQLKNEENYKSKVERTTQGSTVFYKTSAPFPGLNKDVAELVYEKINKTIKKRKKEENVSLGNVYIDKEVKNYVVPFTDRSNESIAMSGEILTAGSKIKLEAGKIMRAGIMWRGSHSTDLDLSTMLDNTELSWRNPNVHGIGSSSGDITRCNASEFSTELVDIDLDKAANKFNKMFNHVVMYSGTTMDKLETYFFIQVFDKKDRPSNQGRIKFDLSKVDYAVKIENENSRSQLGFVVNLKKMEAVVINKKLNSNSQLTIGAVDKALAAINDVNTETSLKNMLKKCIKKSQIVDNKEDADLIISLDEGLHPARDLAEIQKIVF